MQYNINVTIINPEGNEQRNYALECFFIYDEDTYGKKHYLSISGKNFNEQYLDLRYDPSFNRDKKAEYLEQWARNYWSGANGSWTIRELKIS